MLRSFCVFLLVFVDLLFRGNCLYVINKRTGSSDDGFYMTQAMKVDRMIKEGVDPQVDKFSDDKVLTYPQVNTTSGMLKGATLHDTHAFYSIPYAEEPVRYMPPVDVKYRGDIDVFTPNYVRCHQGKENCTENGVCDKNYQDDCLVLNVNVPSTIDLNNPPTSTENQLPVMFSIHGGAFFAGSGTSMVVNGRYLSNSTNTIIVSINYRLDALGFLVYEEGSTRFEGNQGIYDQQMALQWVQDNIHNFGGNKDEVTIFGVSAGAQSVMLHLLSKKSEPLFKRALMQSNPAIYTYPTRDEAKLVTEKLLIALNCSSQALDCLTNTSSKDIVNVRSRVMASALAEGDVLTGVEPYRPIIDGGEFTDQPLTLFRHSKWQTYKEVIMGTTTEELGEINAILANISLGEALFQSANILLLGDYYGPIVAEEYKKLAQLNGLRLDYTDALAQEVADMFFVCPSRAMARFISNTSTNARSPTPTYLYANAHAPSGESCQELNSNRPEKCGYAYHGSDAMFVFGTGPDIGYNFSSNDQAVSDMLAQFWGTFAYNGYPSNDVNVWPSYVNLGQGEVTPWSNIRFEVPESKVESEYRKDLCDFWDSTGYYLDMTTTTTETVTDPTLTKSTTVTDPTSTTVTDPTSATITDPTSTTVTDPTSTTVAGPTSATVTGPISTKSTTVTDPTSATVTDPTSATVTDPTSTTVTDPTSATITDPTSTSVTDPTSTTVAGPTSAMVTGPISTKSTTVTGPISTKSTTVTDPTSTTLESFTSREATTTSVASSLSNSFATWGALFAIVRICIKSLFH